MTAFRFGNATVSLAAVLLVGTAVCSTAFSSKSKRLAVHAKAGLSASYMVAVAKADYPGASLSKPTEKMANTTPVEIFVSEFSGSNGMARITTGPLIVNGRSVGRSKVDQFPVDARLSTAGRSPAPMFVLLPWKGVSVGGKWKSAFYGPSPLPAGLVANYKMDGVYGRFAGVSMHVGAVAASKVEGSGKLYLRLSDGLIDHGSCKFDISYIRPDMKDRSKMVVNSHTVVTIKVSAQK